MLTSMENLIAEKNDKIEELASDLAKKVGLRHFVLYFLGHV